MTTAAPRNDFIRDIIDDDLRTGKHQSVVTRFPPEPNGYLHIGHAKSICLNFGLARDYGGRCNLRFDDTNPVKEDIEYVHSIEADIRWLGFSPAGIFYAADYFPRMYQLALALIRAGKAYVCDLSDEQIKEFRGTLSEPGRDSPFRTRSASENLALFEQMRAGEFPDGARVLRAKIDMASANMKMRDPLLYRIRHASHHRTGDTWCVYPMYDYAHPLSDAFEGITHSICTLEFENNRELYDWVIAATQVSPVPRQYEFARLNLDYTVMSKRKLLQLVMGKHVTGWDDPRMPTIAGMRRRGYRPEAIRAFCDLIGVAKANSAVDLGKLEYCVRDDLNHHAPRVMAVLRPLPVELTNWNRDDEVIDAPYFPADVGKPGSRDVVMSGHLFIDQEDFRDDPPAGYQRLAPGRTVRLRYAYCITCDEVVRDAEGAVVGLRCTVHPETKGGKNPTDGRAVSGVVHWVPAAQSLAAEVRVYDRLFKVPHPDDGDFLEHLNPASLEVVSTARVEPSLASAAPGSRWQFERTGYFVADPGDSRPGALVFGRIVTLRDAWVAAGDKPTPAARADDKEVSRDNAKARTRPKGKSPLEYRAEARARDPLLAAAHLRAVGELGLAADQADLLTGDRATAQLFLDVVAACGNAAAAARWIINEVPRALGGKELGEAEVSATHLAELVTLVESGAIPTAAAKEVLVQSLAQRQSPRAIVAERGLDAAVDESTLTAMVDQVVASNPDKAAQYRAGKTGLLGFFVGQVVRASSGKADPAKVSQLLASRLG